MARPARATEPDVHAAAIQLDLAQESVPWSRGRTQSRLVPVAMRSHEEVAAGGTSTPSNDGGRPMKPASEDDSAALVARARGGDRTAFRALFDRHRPDVARLVYRMVGPRAEMEDLVQEVFVQVHRSLRDFRGDARFSTWLHRVTVNVVLMHRRAERSRPVLAEELPVGTVEDIGSVRPDDEAERRARIAAFFSVLEGISEKKRIVFVLHDLEGLSPVEISAIVEAPVLTVRTRLFYARRELEERMREHTLLAPVLASQGGFAGEIASASQTRRKSADPVVDDAAHDEGGEP
jgi:RNA polymerase sigma-70 factor (ECF subfamily)